MGQTKEKSITLPATKLRFKPFQLSYMNRKMTSMLENGVRNHCVSYLESKPDGRGRIELLLRRLLIGAAQADTRFKSRYLIDLNIDEDGLSQDGSLNLRYLIRLDCLSDAPGSISIYYSGSSGGVVNGLAEARIASWAAPRWQDLTDENGYLMRRLMERRLADLLALASSPEGPPCTRNSIKELDLIRMGSLGIADARVVSEILQSGSDMLVFPAGDSPVVPQVSDYHIAIVEDADGVTLRLRQKTQGCSHVECHSSGSNESYGYYDTTCQYDICMQTTEIKLILGLDVPEWAPGSDFPWRIPLHHEDSLLMYKAATTGSYLMSSCAGRTSRCWTVSLPAAAALLRSREGVDSVLKNARTVLLTLREHLSIPEEALNSATLLRFESSASDSNLVLYTWRAHSLSRLVLTILDDLVKASRTADGFVRDYFHQGLRWEISYDEGSVIEGFLRRLHSESFGVGSKMKNRQKYDDFNDENDESDRSEIEERFVKSLIEKIEGVMKERSKNHRRPSNFFDVAIADTNNQKKEHRVSYKSYDKSKKKSLFSKKFNKRKSLELDGEAPYAQGRTLEIYEECGTLKRDKKIDSFKLATNFTSDPILADYFTDLYEAIREAKCFMIKAPNLNHDGSNVLVSLSAAILYLGRRAGPAASGAAHPGEMQTFRTFLNAIIRGAQAGQWIADGAEKGWCWAKSLLNTLEQSGDAGLDLVVTAGSHCIGETYTVRITRRNIPRNRRLADRKKRSKSLDLRSYTGSITTNDRWSALKPIEDQTGIDINMGQSLMATFLRVQDRLSSRDSTNLVNVLLALKKISAVQDSAAILPEAERRSLLRAIGHASRHSLRSGCSISGGLNNYGHAHIREIFRGNVQTD